MFRNCVNYNVINNCLLNIELIDELKKVNQKEKLIFLQKLLVVKKFNMYTPLDQSGSCLIHIACKNGQLDMVHALIEVYGCSLHVVDKFGCTPCNLACEKGRVEIMKYFFTLKPGLSCLLHNNNMETWLHSAVKSGSLQLIQLVVYFFLNKRYLTRNRLKLVEFNDDILYHCFHKNKFTKLSSHFFNLFRIDKDGDSPVHVACRKNDLATIKFFISELGLVLNFSFNAYYPSFVKLACQLRRKRILKYLSQFHRTDSLIEQQLKAVSPEIEKLLFLFQSNESSPIQIKSASPFNSFYLNKSALFYTLRRGDFKLYNNFLRSFTSFKVTNKTGDTLLHAASVSGNLKLFTLIYDDLCHANVDPMAKNNEGNTCLHVTCEWGWSEIVKYLIDKKCSINEQNILNESAIHIAIKYKRKDIFDMLLEKSDLDTVNEYGETPLHLATCDPNGMEYVKAIVGCNSNGINVPDHYGDTPLFNACRTRNKEMVLFLLNQPQCEVLTVNKHTNESIATIACRLSWMEILREIFQRIEHYPFKFQNYMGQTLFHIACWKDDLELINYLVSLPKLYDLGGDMNLLDKLHELTPLQYGCVRNNTELVQYLHNLRGCSPDTKNNNGNTALHICAKHNLLEMARICLRYCSLKVRNEYGNTPIHLACNEKNIELLKLFVQSIPCGSNFDSFVNKEGKNILHVVAEQDGTLDILKHMIKSKMFDYKYQGQKGNTALHYAFQNGVLSNAEYLLSLDSYNENWLNKDGESPLYLAVTMEHCDFIKSIVKKCDKNMLMSCFRDFHPKVQYFSLSEEHVTIPLILVLLSIISSRYSYSIMNLLHYLLLNQCLHPDLEEVKDTFGNSILHYLAMCRCHDKLIKIFDHVSKTINVNVVNKGLSSPLHYACQSTHSWMVFYLLQNSKNCAVKSLNINSSIGQPCSIVHNNDSRLDVLRYLAALGATNVVGLKSEVCSQRNKSMAIGILVLGNSTVGKTTLIQTLKMMITDDRQVHTVSQPTTGIVKEEFVYYKNKHRYIFYDFAGQVEFETVHSVHLRDLLSSAHGTKNHFIFLLLVKGSDTLEDNKRQIEKWISFVQGHVRINSTTVHVVLICTHDDQFKSDEEQEERKYDLTEYFKTCFADPLVKYEHPIFLNGTRADTSPVSQVMGYLEDMFISCDPVEYNEITDEVLHYIEKWYSKNPCQVKDFIDKIKESRIFKLHKQDEKIRVSGSERNMIIPQELNSLVIHLNQLFCQHDILLLKPQESEPLDWWIVGSKVQNELFSKANSLFSPDYFPDKAHHSLDTYNTGVVPLSKLTEVFRELELETQLAISYLISLEFCTEISEETANIIGSSNSKDEKKMYFFPGLIKSEKDDKIVEEVTKTGYITSGLLIENSRSWDLRFLHILLLRLTYQFAEEKKQYYNRRIHLWKNGLQVFTDNLIEVILELKHDKVICLFLRCSQEISSKIDLAQVRHIVLKVIRSLSEKMSLTYSTVNNISESIVYPHPQSFSSMGDSVKIPLPELVNVFRKPTTKRAYFLSDNKPISLRELFHFEPYVFVQSKKEATSTTMNVKTIGELCEIPELKPVKDDTISFAELQEIFQKYSVYSANDLHPFFEHFCQ